MSGEGEKPGDLEAGRVAATEAPAVGPAEGAAEGPAEGAASAAESLDRATTAERLRKREELAQEMERLEAAKKATGTETGPAPETAPTTEPEAEPVQKTFWEQLEGWANQLGDFLKPLKDTWESVKNAFNSGWDKILAMFGLGSAGAAAGAAALKEGPEALPNYESLELQLPAEALITSDIQTDREQPVTKVHRPHEGVDIGIPEGTQLHSPGEGLVKTVAGGPNGSGGYYVEIAYLVKGEIKIFRFLHLKERSALQKGSRIKPGELIGLSGASGKNVTGPHLHFEVRNGKANGPEDDPFHYLPNSLQGQLVTHRTGKHDELWSHEEGPSALG